MSNYRPTPTRRRSTAIVSVFIVLVLILVGSVGWLIIRPMLNGDPASASGTPDPTEQPSNIPSQTGNSGSVTTAVVPAEVPVNLLAGVDRPDQVILLGVWSGIGVFSLGYSTPEAAVLGHAVLRGVRVTTGEVLWTMSSFPDGKLIQIRGVDGLQFDLAGVVSAWNGNLALLLGAASADCPTGEDFAFVLSLETGTMLSGQLLPDSCAGSDDQSTTPAMSEQLVTYTDGMVVLTRQDPDSWTAGTTAYRDSDLGTSVWENQGDYDPDLSGDWTSSDRLLDGQWVLSADGSYVSLTDGKKSGLTATIARDQTAGPVFTTAAGLIVQTVPQTKSASVRLAGWDDPTADDPAWSVSLAAAQPAIACSTDNVIVVNSTGAMAGVADDISLIALSAADGSVMWTQSVGSGPVSCLALVAGGKDLIAYNQGTSLHVVDAQDGTDYGDKTAFFPAGLGKADSWGLTTCGTTMICLTTTTIDTANSPVSFATTVAAVDLSTPDLSTPWSHSSTTDYDSQTWAYATDAGLVIPVGGIKQGYSFLII